MPKPGDRSPPDLPKQPAAPDEEDALEWRPRSPEELEERAADWHPERAEAWEGLKKAGRKGGEESPEGSDRRVIRVRKRRRIEPGRGSRTSGARTDAVPPSPATSPTTPSPAVAPPRPRHPSSERDRRGRRPTPRSEISGDRRPGPDRRRRRKRRSARSRRRRRIRIILLSVIGLGAVLAGISLIPAYLAGSAMERGREAVERGQELLLNAKNPSLAVDAFAVAEKEFDEAAGHASNPLIRLGSFVPVLGRTPDALSRLANVGISIARAGSSLSSGAAQITGGLAALAPRAGRIPIETYQSLAPRFRYARSELDAASRELTATASSLLIPPVGEAVDLVRTEMEDVLPMVQAADSILGALPQLAGADGTRRYLVAAQNPAELRGTGGIMGMHSIMTIRKGKIRLGPFEDKFPPDPREGSIKAPSGYGPPYTGFGSPTTWLNANAVPDAPTAAIMLERMWKRVKGERLDGVVLVTPQALESMLGALGPIEVPKLDFTVNEKNVVQFTTNDAFFLFNNRQQLRNRALGLVAEEVLKRFFRETRSTAGIEAVAEAASNGYIVVHAADPEVHRGFAEAGVDGTFSRAGRDFFSVIVNNIAGNKVDYYAERTIDYSVALQAGGKAAAEATVRLENTAPTQKGYNEALGPYPVHREHPEGLQLRSGENYSFVTFYCSAKCGRGPGQTEPAETPLGPYPQGSTTVFTSTPRLLSGQSRTYRLKLRTEGAWRGDETGGVYRLRLGGQATIKPIQTKVAVTLPPGMQLVEASVPVTQEGSAIVWEGTLGSTQDIELRFQLPGWEKLWIRAWDFLSHPVVRIG